MKLHIDKDWLRRMTELGDDEECCLVGPPMMEQDLKELLNESTKTDPDSSGRETRIT